MNPILTWKRPQPFETAVLLSLALHVVLWLGFRERARQLSEEIPRMEIDLTRPFRLVSDPRLEKRVEKPRASAPVVNNLAPAVAPPVAPVPPREWVLPKDQNQETVKPTTVDDPNATSSGMGGEGDGEVDLIYLTQRPGLLNRDDLLRILKTAYQGSQAARSGVEGTVVLVVHLSAKGAISAIEVASNLDPELDALAKRTIQEKAQYSPAMIRERAVAVKFRQAVPFQLTEE